MNKNIYKNKFNFLLNTKISESFLGFAVGKGIQIPRIPNNNTGTQGLGSK